MDASQYKDYVLTLRFLKYVSDKYAGKPNAIIEVPEGGSFTDIIKLKGDKDNGDKIKQGMMQQLLTGRVRLVKPEAAEEANI